MFTVRITDEFYTVFSLTCESASEVSKVVSEWLSASESGETPIYEIVIEVTP